ncbi:MAG: esterase family protein, partial [Anaerolineae bacterium]|nr:esterase family protein [Anaerolineae bacterium]
IYLDCGLDDERAWRAADLHAALKARHIPHTYTCRPGQYGPDYWRANLAEYIGFYAAGW